MGKFFFRTCIKASNNINYNNKKQELTPVVKSKYYLIQHSLKEFIKSAQIAEKDFQDLPNC